MASTAFYIDFKDGKPKVPIRLNTFREHHNVKYSQLVHNELEHENPFQTRGHIPDESSQLLVGFNVAFCLRFDISKTSSSLARSFFPVSWSLQWTFARHWLCSLLLVLCLVALCQRVRIMRARESSFRGARVGTASSVPAWIFSPAYGAVHKDLHSLKGAN